LAARASEAMAEQFGFDKDDVNVVMVTTATGEAQPVIMYTGKSGLYKGSWDQIQDAQFAERFMLNVDGERLDTRKGMTAAAYIAMMSAARDAGVQALPDSRLAAESTNRQWTKTLLTGEPLFDGQCRAARTEQGRSSGIKRVDFSRHDIDDGSVELCFRPAIWLDNLTQAPTLS
jgi:hypothetical protein